MICNPPTIIINSLKATQFKMLPNSQNFRIKSTIFLISFVLLRWMGQYSNKKKENFIELSENVGLLLRKNETN